MITSARPEQFAGRYELGAVIGHGGMGLVYQAYDLRLQRKVAIKVLHAGTADDVGNRSRFEHEAMVAARINHPNVVTVFDVGDTEHQLYIVMELVDGPTLAEVLAAGPLPVDRARAMAIELLGGLAAAHAEGVLHRDIKPANVMFGANGTAKLGDFGIAKLTESLDLTAAGVVIGTAAYLPPERLSGAPATEAGDLYAMGVLLYESLAGDRPFPGATPVAVAQAMADVEPTPIELVNPRVDPAFAAVVRRAMAKVPGDRFSSAITMAAAIQDEATAAAGAAVLTAVAPVADVRTVLAPVAAAPTTDVDHRPERRSRRSVWLVGALLVALVLATSGYAIATGGPGAVVQTDAPAVGSSPTTPAATNVSPTTIVVPTPTATTVTVATTPLPTPPTEPHGKAKGKGKG